MIKNSRGAWKNNSVSAFDGSQSAHAMLGEIRRRLFSTPETLEKELVALENAVSRIAAENLRAKYDTPLFDESSRDGFAVAPQGDVDCRGEKCFQITGSTGAGDYIDTALLPGEAWQVMTGGKVPGNCERIIPQEWCTVNGRTVTIPSKLFLRPSYINRRGEQVQKGDLIVPAGEVISPASLVKLAQGGWHELAVFRRPKVCFCCTGKELVDSGVLPEDAQKISANKYLLAALIEQCGCLGYDHGIVGDEEEMVGKFFTASLLGAFDLVLTTGGTGGGAFDLIEKGFTDAGGTLLCTSLELRPGKSLVAGEKNGVLYIGLPGPPTAVHTVFLEIVAPILQLMSGACSAEPTCIEAIAGEDITFKTRGSLLVKEGILSFDGGRCMVRRAGRKEHSTCNLLIAPGRDEIKKGEKVEVHLREPLRR